LVPSRPIERLHDAAGTAAPPDNTRLSEIFETSSFSRLASIHARKFSQIVGMPAAMLQP